MREITGFLNGIEKGRAGLIERKEDEPFVGEEVLIPANVREHLRFGADTGIVTDYEPMGPWWALYLTPVVDNPCDEDFMREIST